MAVEAPKKVKPIVDFCTQVTYGAVGFVVVMLAAGLIWVVVHGLESAGLNAEWFVHGADYAERGIFYLDLFGFGFFALSETVTLVRRIIKEQRTHV